MTDPMGSVIETAKIVVDYLNGKGQKTGMVMVRLYRPFSADAFLKSVPATAARIAVLDRTKEPGSVAEPLCVDVRAAFYGTDRHPLIVGGRYGLSSKDTTPEQIVSVFENLASQSPIDNFTIGIRDDVTFKSLPLPKEPIILKEGYEAKFFGIGSDGTVGANKNSVKIIGDLTDKFAQAYFAYDSKKSGGVTVSHLRFGDKPIRDTYLVNNPDFVACHVPVYLEKYDVLKGLKPGGTFLLNSLWDQNEIADHLPAKVKRYLAENNIRFFIINATRISEELGMPGRTNTIMQAAFFKVAGVIPYETARLRFPTEERLILVSKARPGMREEAYEEIRQLLRRLRKTPPGLPDDFGLSTTDQIIKRLDSILSMVVLVSIGLASLGLMVGGIGVMNIMLVSVTERTKEIGVRKAIGARKFDIVIQFLTEAVTLAGIGGVAGIAFAALVTMLVGKLVPALAAPMPGWAVMMGFLVSVGVGIFFGTWPAMKAANLDPVEALRYE